MKNKKIGIIGGRGAMGSFFCSFFKEQGFTVFISDIGTKLSNIELVKKSDIIFLSVPLDITIEVIDEIAPFLNENQLFSDFSSLKENIIKAMFAKSKASIIGTHPMFGPFTQNLKGQNIILCPARDSNNWEEKLKAIFKLGGFNITCMNATEHDEHMAFVQGLTHLISIAFGQMMQKKNVSSLDLEKISTPIFRLNRDLTGRLFHQDLSLYYSIIKENPYTQKNINLFLDAFSDVQKKIMEEDKKEGMNFLNNIKGFLKDISKKSFERSSKVLDTFFNTK